MRIKIWSLRFKILVALSLLAGVTFFLVSYLTIEHMKHLGKYTIDACSVLGKSAVGDSKEALLAEAREELHSLVAGQAQLIDSQLKRVAGQMNLTANLCSRYMKSTPDNPDDLSSYLSQTKPSDLNKYASYHLSSGVTMGSARDELKRLGRLQPVLKFIQSNNPGSDIVYIGTPGGIFVSSPWTAQPADYDPRLRNWYQQASKSESAVWVGPYISSNGNKLTLTCAKAARNSKGDVIAVCAIDVEVESVVKNMMITRLEPQSKAFVIDREGNVVVRRDINAAGVTWNQEYKKDNLLRSPDTRISEVARKMAAGKHGVDDLVVPGEALHFLAYCPITTTGWSIGIAVPK
ncbi:MAG: cache domain-containing protein, partial [Victivallaceae bacterium]